MSLGNGWLVGHVAMSSPSGCGCYEWLGPPFYGGDNVRALSDDGTAYTEEGSNLGVLSFPYWETTTYLNLESDVTFPPGTWDYGGTPHPAFSGGMCVAGDGYLYAWVSNDVHNGQQVIAKFDPADLANPTILWNDGETPDLYEFFRSSSITWCPATPDRLWCVLTQVNANDDGDGPLPPPYTSGRSHLFSVDLATGARTDVLDLTTLTDLQSAYIAFTFRGLQQWDLGPLFALPVYDPDIGGDRVWIVAYDAVNGGYGAVPVGPGYSAWFAAVPCGAHGHDQIVGVSYDSEADPQYAPLTALDLDVGGAMTPGTPVCDDVFLFDNGDFIEQGTPVIWYAPPDHRGTYMSDRGNDSFILGELTEGPPPPEGSSGTLVVPLVALGVWEPTGPPDEFFAGTFMQYDWGSATGGADSGIGSGGAFIAFVPSDVTVLSVTMTATATPMAPGTLYLQLFAADPDAGTYVDFMVDQQVNGADDSVTASSAPVTTFSAGLDVIALAYNDSGLTAEFRAHLTGGTLTIEWEKP